MRSVQAGRIARGLAVLVPLVLLFAAATAAASRTVESSSTISIKTTGLRFHGRVASGQTGCQEQRRVVLFKAVHGGPAEAMGHATTNRRGAWSVTVSGFAGISLTPFYARVAKTSQGAAGTIYVCDAARSRTIKLSGAS